ncbi:MAG: hypothetical protein RTV72_01340 [Candidatus Thorarchaeota archaeon]
MSQNPNCPYCSASVPIDHVRVGYDEKVKVRCHNCGGQFEYMPGFGSFSLPGEGPRTQRRVATEGSYHGTVYEGEVPWTTESTPPKQSGCGTCCAIICCLIGISVIFPIMWLFSGLLWWLFSW